MKSALIGSNKAKNRVIEAGVVPRLLNLLTDPNVSNTDLRVAVAYTLGMTKLSNYSNFNFIYINVWLNFIEGYADVFGCISMSSWFIKNESYHYKIKFEHFYVSLLNLNCVFMISKNTFSRQISTFIRFCLE